MKKVIDYFLEITKIPHCSFDALEFRDFLLSFAQKRGYRVEVDKAENILAKKGVCKLAFQAHYDMVCVGKAPNIETYIEDGWMMAKESSLGADNGIAVAMMMALIDEGVDGEFLFTSDEEVGLIGANALEFKIESKQMLNLDSEDEAEVYIGCAGGVDIEALKCYKSSFKSGKFYEITISGLQGGHSGVDIDKNIPNAIKLFASFLRDKDLQIASINGGERVNSIPANLKATIFCSEDLKSEEFINVKEITGSFEVIDGSEIISVIDSFKDGVISFDSDLNIPDKSINLAIISLKDKEIKIQTSARAMDNRGLEDIEKSYQKYFKDFGFDVVCEGKYPAWKPEINSFSKEVEKAMIEIFKKSEFRAIHAGLECAIISKKYPNLKLASIGPNIKFPHSTSEKVEIDSVDKTYRVIKKLLNI